MPARYQGLAWHGPREWLETKQEHETRIAKQGELAFYEGHQRGFSRSLSDGLSIHHWIAYDLAKHQVLGRHTLLSFVFSLLIRTRAAALAWAKAHLVIVLEIARIRGHITDEP